MEIAKCSDQIQNFNASKTKVSLELRLFCGLDQFVECRCIIHRKISQNFTVNVDVVLLQRVDELGIAHPVRADGRIDTDDPQGTKITFLKLTVAGRIGHSFFDRFDRSTQYIFPLAKVAFCLLKYLLAASFGCRVIG